VADGRGHSYPSGWEGPVPAELGRAWVAAGHAESLEKADGESEPPTKREKPRTKRTATRRAPRNANTDD
jgi:hypothetical protein